MSDQRWIIPDTLFVGLSRNVRSHAPLANFTCAGTDSGAKGRMQTVKNHSSETWTLQNTPQWGITIGGSSWKDEIRMEDPRGFAVNVRVDNVLQMMKECTVVNGIIQAPCVWARSNGQNVLLAVGSETHELAQIQTRLANSKVPLKNVKLGDWVTLNNGVKGVYLGKYHKLTFESNTWIRGDNPSKLQVDDTARVAIWQPVMSRSWKPTHNQCVMFITNPVVAEHEPGDHAYTDVEAEFKLNELLQDATCYVQSTHRSYYLDVVLMATRKPIQIDQLSIKMEPTVYADADEVGMCNHKVHWSPDGQTLWMWAGQNRHNLVTLYEWDPVALKQNELKFLRISKINHNNTASQRVLDVKQALQDLYLLKATYTTSLGNQITATI